MNDTLPLSVISQKFVNDGTIAFRDLSICENVFMPSSFVRWFCKKYHHNLDLPLVVTDELLKSEYDIFKNLSICG